MRRPITCAILIGVLSGLSLGRADASSVTDQAPDLATLVAGAELVCEVQILDATSALLADGSIETRYSFSTLTPIKGTMASIQEVRIPGGEVAGQGLVLPGMPDLQVGDRSILFLSEPTQTKQWRMPVGMEAGAMKVQPAVGSVAAKVQRRGAESGHVEVEDYDVLLAEIFAEVQRQG
ncbi:MAG: hypothetical protein ACYTEP_04435 [Planctomycetota bacterium]